MPTITLRFHACRIHDEGIATDEDGDYFEGYVDLDVVAAGAVQTGLIARVKQAAGSTFAEPLEIQLPAGMHARVPYRGFRDCVEDYVRHQVAAHILRQGDTHNIRVRDITLRREATCVAAMS